MTQEIKENKSLLVFQKLILYNNSLSDEPFELEETLRYSYPHKFRSDILYNNTEKIHIIFKDRAITVTDGKITADSETLLDHYKDILLYNSRELLVEKLSLLGIDLSVSSFGRFKDKIAYVIGAFYPDITVPQVWIDKKTFRPIRLILIDGSSQFEKNPLDIRYLEWKKAYHAWYPMRILFYQNDILIREIQVNHIETDPFFSDDIFDVERFKSAYQPVIPELPNRPNGLSEVQRTIEEFKKTYE